MAKKKLLRKIAKAAVAAGAAYGMSKAMAGQKGWRSNLKHTFGKSPIKQVGGDASIAEAVHGAKHFRKPLMLGDTGKSMDHMVPKKWYEFWKKHGGSVTTAKLGKMIKASQGTYAREDESLGMRLGKGKGTAKERDMSYGDWGTRKHDWAKSGKMIKARHGTEVRTDGSNPHVPKGGTAYVKTKLNGTLKVKTF